MATPKGMPEYAKGTQQAIAASKKEAELMKKPAPTVAKKPEPVATTKPVAPTVTKKPVVEPAPVKKPEVTAPPVKKQEPVFTTKPFVETKPTVTTPVQKPDVFQETKKAQQEQNNSQAAAILNSVVKQNTASTPPKQEPFVGGSLFNTPSQQNNNLFSSFVQAASPQPSGTTPPTALGTSSAPSITPAINNAPSAPPAIVNAPNNAPSSAPAIVPAQQSATGGLFPAFMSANTQAVAPKTQQPTQPSIQQSSTGLGLPAFNPAPVSTPTPAPVSTPTPAPVSTPTVQATNAQVPAYTSPFATSAPATSAPVPAPAPVSAPMQEKPPVLPPFSSTMGVNQQPTSLLDVFKSVPFTPKVEQPTTPATSAPAQGGITLPAPGSGTPVQEGAAADFMKERSAVLPQTAVPEVKKSFAELSPEEKQKLFPLDKPIVGVDQLTQMVKPPAPPSPMSQANLDQIKQKQQAAPAPVPAPMSQENLKRLQQEEAAKRAAAGKPSVAPSSPSVTTSPTAQPTTPEQEMDFEDFAIAQAAREVDLNIDNQMKDIDNQLQIAQQARDTGKESQLKAYKMALQEQRDQNFQQLEQMKQQMADRGMLSSGLLVDAQARIQMAGNRAIQSLAEKQMSSLQKLDLDFKQAFDKATSAKEKLTSGRSDEISKITNSMIKENSAVQADARKMDVELRKLQIEENKTMLNTMKSTLDRLKSAQINTLPFEGFYLAGDTEGLARALAASDNPELSVLGQQTVARIEQTKSDILRNAADTQYINMGVQKRLSDIDKQRSDTTGNVWINGKMLKDSKGNPIRTLDAIYNDKKLSIQQQNAEANKVRAATARAKANSKSSSEVKAMTQSQQLNFLQDTISTLIVPKYETQKDDKGKPIFDLDGVTPIKVKVGEQLNPNNIGDFNEIMADLWSSGKVSPDIIQNQYRSLGLKAPTLSDMLDMKKNPDR